MIIANKHYNRGSVLHIEQIPEHLRIARYIAKGVINVERVTPLDQIEVADTQVEDTRVESMSMSPMKELTLDQIETVEPLEEEEIEKPHSVPVTKNRLRRR